MSRPNEELERVRRNLLQDLRESPLQDEKFQEFANENFDKSVIDYSAAGLRTFNFHESDRLEHRSCVLSVSSLSSVELIPAASVAQFEEFYLCCDNPSDTLSNAMKNLRLHSERRKRSASPLEEKSSLDPDVGVGENEVPCVESDCIARISNRREPGVSSERGSERDARFEHLGLPNSVASAVETLREEIGAAKKKWSSATVVKKSKASVVEKESEVAEDADAAQRERLPVRIAPLPAEKPRLPVCIAPLPAEKPRLPVCKAPLPAEKPRLPAEKPRLPVCQAPLPAEKPRLPVCKAPLPAEKPRLSVRKAPLPVDRALRRSSKCCRRSGQFVSMAEAIRKFHTATPGRYRTYARTSVARPPRKLPSASGRSPSRSTSAKESENRKNEAVPRGAKKASISPSADCGKREDCTHLCLPKARDTIRLHTSPTRGLSSAMRSRRELVAKPESAPANRVQDPPSDHKLCLPVDPVRKHDARHTSDARIRQKEIGPDAMRLEAENEAEFHKRESRQLRRTMEIRARPMPKFKPPVIAKSSKPLTEPHSPAWSRRK